MYFWIPIVSYIQLAHESLVSRNHFFNRDTVDTCFCSTAFTFDKSFFSEKASRFVCMFYFALLRKATLIPVQASQARHTHLECKYWPYVCVTSHYLFLLNSCSHCRLLHVLQLLPETFYRALTSALRTLTNFRRQIPSNFAYTCASVFCYCNVLFRRKPQVNAKYALGAGIELRS